MAHSVVITNVSHIGDQAFADGTVDGVSVRVTFWWSAIMTLPSTAAVQSFIGNLMVATIAPTPVTTGVYNGAMSI